MSNRFTDKKYLGNCNNKLPTKIFVGDMNCNLSMDLVDEFYHR